MADKSKTAIGKVIKSARINCKLTQNDFGKKLDAELGVSRWSQDYVSKAESGRIHFNEEEILIVAKILNIEPKSIKDAIQEDNNQKIVDKVGVISMDMVEITSEDLMSVLDYVNSIGGKARYGLIRQMLSEMLHNKGMDVFSENSIK